MGAFLRVNIIYCDLEDVIKKNSIQTIYGALLKGENIYTQKLKFGLIVIGNEANGIAEENLKLITNPVTIPSHQFSGGESLNAAMASSILVSEFCRQLSQ